MFAVYFRMGLVRVFSSCCVNIRFTYNQFQNGLRLSQSTEYSIMNNLHSQWWKWLSQQLKNWTLLVFLEAIFRSIFFFFVFVVVFRWRISSEFWMGAVDSTVRKWKSWKSRRKQFMEFCKISFPEHSNRMALDKLRATRQRAHSAHLRSNGL